ncbi:AAA family ATPase [Streptomyces apricus]|uniref:Helix-turn-helix transcriptional regulator n=1 Tax=Streptomyces apricus TaxID=1828112 RepID=A0A5B0AT21_9ACTN|nr:LuxR family transcriptional regulator [Streptomyces apricus]KAA0932466.1 helix-turn-helix transcriptional regulator [Streptomyces apricus]
MSRAGPRGRGRTVRSVPDTFFVGREDELSRMGARLRGAALGEPQVVVVEGPAGIGKTCLVRRFLAEMEPGCRILRASGDDGEMHLPYSVVAQLLVDVGDGLDPPLRELDRCVRPGAVVPDPVVVGSALLDVVSGTQEQSPVVMVVDDAHWADSPSLHALTFALRRLRVDRVLTVLVIRDVNDLRLPAGLRRVLDDDDTLTLHLEGLAAQEICRLNLALGHTPLSRWAAARLREHTRGNPLHTQALLHQFLPEAVAGDEAVLPASPAHERLVSARLDGCGPGTRRLVEAASVLGMSSLLHLAAHIGSVPDPLEALAEALEAGLLEGGTVGGLPKVAFPHPLSRAAVYQGLRPALRSRLHERAARRSNDPAAALHHRAQAAVGPDAELALKLHRLAARQASEGAWSAAASAAMAAARLSPHEADHAARFLDAVEYLLLAGDIGQAVELESQVLELPSCAARHYVLGHLACTAGRLEEARRSLTACWDDCDADTPVDTLRSAAEQLAFLHLTESDTPRAVAWSRRGLELPPGQRSTFLRESLAIGLGLQGRHEEALASLAHLSVAGPRNGPAELDGLMSRGLLRLWNGELSAARRDLKDAFLSHRRGGLPYTGLVALSFLVDAEYRSGHWDDAVAHGTQAVSLAEDTDQVSVLAMVHSLVAGPLAARGDFEAAVAHADKAAEYARALADINDIALAHTALGTVRIAQGDHEGALDALLPLLDPAVVHRAALTEIGPVLWRPLLVEAFVRTGRPDDAEAVLVPYEAGAAERDRWLDMAAAARCRGMLEAARGRSEAAEQAFRAGLDHCERGGPCWERTLLQLAFGTFLRRSGKRSAAVAQLQPACEALHRLEAVPYRDRCDVELAACGRAPGRVALARHPVLTAQELTVTRLAVRGMTNRQIARELVLSVKTIEYHLGNAYAKLGINSRMELGHRLAPQT